MEFRTVVNGFSPKDAFNSAVQEAMDMYGRNIYSCSIADKETFCIVVPDEAKISAYISKYKDDVQREIAYCKSLPVVGENRNLFRGERGFFTRTAFISERERQLKLQKLSEDIDESSLMLVAVEAWMKDNADNIEIEDKSRCAGCVVIRKADRKKRLSQETAEKKAKQLHGDSAVVETDTKEGLGSLCSIVLRSPNSDIVVAWGKGRTEEEARGNALRKHGVYMFFG